jgi:hypothetical protein
MPNDEATEETQEARWGLAEGENPTPFQWTPKIVFQASEDIKAGDVVVVKEDGALGNASVGTPTRKPLMDATIPVGGR